MKREKGGRRSTHSGTTPLDRKKRKKKKEKKEQFIPIQRLAKGGSEDSGRSKTRKKGRGGRGRSQLVSLYKRDEKGR